MKDKMIKLILVGLILAVMSPLAIAYPPDNAAVLYYKAFLMYEVDDDMGNMLGKLRKGKIELNDEIREFVKKNKSVIETVLDGSEIEKCDWGSDLSLGFDLEVPYLGKLRRIVNLLCADTMILIEQGSYADAINRYICIYKMARHVNDYIAIGNLVGASCNVLANRGLVKTLSDMPVDIEMLEMLKNKLSEIDAIPFSMEPAFKCERQVILSTLTMEKKGSFVKWIDPGNEALEKIILEADEPFLAKNRAYWNELMDGMEDAFKLPYVQAFEKLRELEKQALSDEVKKKTPLVYHCLGAWANIYSSNIRWQSGFNAVKAAVDVYMIKAKTGKLPDELPAGLPIDMFSGKAFEYKKTGDGFVLKCPGKELRKGETYEYKFTVK